MTADVLWDAQRYAAESARMLALARESTLAGTLLCADLTQPKAAVERLIALRRAGERAILVPVADDALEAIVIPLWAQIASLEHRDQRFQLAAAMAQRAVQANGKSLPELAAPAPEVVRGLYAAFRLADAVIVDSEEQRRRWEALIRRALPRTIVIPPFDAIPARSAAAGYAAVVYAPRYTRAELGFFTAAFARRKMPLAFVCRDASDESVLANAPFVIVPEWHRLADVARFAREGRVVVAPQSSGAAEYDLATTYDPLSARSLSRAIDLALTQTLPARHVPAVDLGERLAEKPLPLHGPLVSVIVRTFNRPVLLARALASIAAQTYRDLEVVVVNDGGPDVAHVVDAFRERLPRVRYLHRATNGGIVEANNEAARAVSGTYVGYLDDDDLWYPEHVARLVAALEQTGAEVVYGNCVAEYADKRGETFVTSEFAVFTDKDFDPETFLYDNLATIHSFLHRRDLFDRYGYFDEAMSAAEDWEMWIRLSRDRDFVHVDRVTAEYSWRFDDSAGNTTVKRTRNFAAAHRHVYAKYAAELAHYPSLLAAHQQGLQQKEQLAQALDANPALARQVFGPPQPTP